MSLFHFGKKKTNQENTTCSCGCCGCQPQSQTNSCGCNIENGEAISIKVLGSGCKSCHQLYENAKQAVKDGSLHAEVEYITDMKQIASYGIMTMPALLINNKVAATGKVLTSTEILDLLKK